MSVGEALRDLSRVVDEYEQDGTITSVGITGERDPNGSGTVTAEVELDLSARPSADDGRSVLRGRGQGDSGRTLPVPLDSTTPAVLVSDREIDVEVTNAALATDGTITLAFSTAVVGDAESAEQTAPEAEDRGDPPANSLYGRDVPPFEDPELLGEVYEACDTFSEMADELGMDVTAETIRRYMIDHGIHEPNSYDTDDETADDARGDRQEVAEAAAGNADSQVVLADGVGLPDEITAEALVETVRRSNTIFEVKQDLGVEREEALELLKQLDLLEFVVGRLATTAERQITRDEVIHRLRRKSLAA